MKSKAPDHFDFLFHDLKTKEIKPKSVYHIKPLQNDEISSTIEDMYIDENDVFILIWGGYPINIDAKYMMPDLFDPWLSFFDWLLGDNISAEFPVTSSSFRLIIKAKKDEHIVSLEADWQAAPHINKSYLKKCLVVDKHQIMEATYRLLHKIEQDLAVFGAIYPPLSYLLLSYQLCKRKTQRRRATSMTLTAPAPHAEALNKIQSSSNDITIFLAWHSYEDGKCEEAKLIGAFSTREKAQNAIKKVRNKPGFRKWPNGFEISETKIDRMEWSEGFGFE